jgi:hypothetical protein
MVSARLYLDDWNVKIFSNAVTITRYQGRTVFTELICFLDRVSHPTVATQFLSPKAPISFPSAAVKFVKIGDIESPIFTAFHPPNPVTV